MAVLVRDLMKPEVVSVDPRTPVAEARAKMAALEIRHLPIADEGRRLVGIVSQRDLAGDLDGRAIFEVMRREVVTVRPDTSAQDAVTLLIQHKIGALPVVDADGRLVGVLTETDFLVVAQQALFGIEPTPHARA